MTDDTDDCNFEEEIRFLKEEAHRTLKKVNKQEEYMEKKKVDRYDLKELSQLTKKFLRILSTIDGYEHFKAKSELITDENTNKFVFIVENYYSLRFNLFKNDIKNRK